MPTLEINGNLVTDITLGGHDVIRINHAVSGVLLWEKAQPAPTTFLCFTAGQSNSTVGYTSTLSTPPTIYKSTDQTNWTAWDGTAVTLANAGDKIYLYGENSGVSGHSLLKFSMTGSIAASGDVTSLLSYSGADAIPSYAFGQLFSGCSALTAAPDIPATSAREASCNMMFARCSGLTTAPALPATNIGSYCYEQMFYECTSLVTGPTTLPATTLRSNCYDAMFAGCTSLTTAPALPATTLANACYQGMFNGCLLLDYVVVGAETWDSSKTRNWLANVAATGTLKTTGAATGIPSGSADGIPAGWTRVTSGKNITLTYSGYAYSWTTSDGRSGSMSSGDPDYTLAVSDGQTVTFATGGSERNRITLNGVDQCSVSSATYTYTYAYADLSDGDVVSCEYFREPCL